MRTTRAQILHGEEAQSIITVALMSFFLLAIIAVVVESSAVYIQKRNLQNAADAAALAGAQSLDGTSDGEALAETVAENYKNENISGTTFFEADGSLNSHKEILVTVKKKSATAFAGWLSFGQPEVTAKARARISNVNISEGIVPIAVPSGNIAGTQGQIITITSGVPDSVNGPTVGNIQLPPRDPKKDPQCTLDGGNGNGGNDLGDGIECGSAVGVSLGQILDAKPGGTAGQVRDGFIERVANSTNIFGPNSRDCLTLDDIFTDHTSAQWVIDPDCAPGSFKTMLVMVPVISAWDFGKNGKGPGSGSVTELALFWVDPSQKFKCSGGGVCEIDGMWITNYAAPLTPSGGGTPGGPFDIFKIVELIE
jgi:Flp pilus assembly protein TadG